jgi:hypothetical protein
MKLTIKKSFNDKTFGLKVGKAMLLFTVSIFLSLPIFGLFFLLETFFPNIFLSNELPNPIFLLFSILWVMFEYIFDVNFIKSKELRELLEA